MSHFNKPRRSGVFRWAFFLAIFLQRRNQTIVASIDRLIEGNSLFVLVGAAHLPGENGVLNMLKEKEYTVKNIPLALETVK